MGSFGTLRTMLAMLASAALLAGCAHPELMKVGMTQEAVEEALGAPQVKVVLPDGSGRWIYSFQGMGQEVWWVNFNTDGLVSGNRQVLDREHFNLIKPGISQKKDVWELFGKSAEQYNFPLQNRTAWMYRFKDEGLFNMACWVEFFPNGTVAEVSYTIDPREGDHDFFHCF